MPTSIRSIIIENITLLSGLALSQGEVSRIIGVSKGVISNVLRRVCERAVSPRGAWVDFFKSSHIYIYVYILNTITSKEDRALLIMRRKSYSQGPGSEWNWSGELDTASFPYSPGTCSCSWILLKTSKRCPRLTPHHRCCRRMLSVSSQTGTLSTGPVRYLIMMSPKSAFTTLPTDSIRFFDLTTH